MNERQNVEWAVVIPFLSAEAAKKAQNEGATNIFELSNGEHVRVEGYGLNCEGQPQLSMDILRRRIADVLTDPELVEPLIQEIRRRQAEKK